MATSRGRRVALPAGSEPSGPLAGAEYAWAYEIPAERAAATSPEQWARAVFEGAPRGLRVFFVVGWRAGLGLRLDSSQSAANILGWSIRQSDPTHVVFEAESRILSAQNTVIVGDTTVTWITVVRYRKPPARVLWALARQLHQQIIPWSLRRADRRRQ
jgi:hypothetical protein